MYTIHAEVSALNDIRKKRIHLKHADMYVVRISTDGKDYRSSTPCEKCQNYIKKFNGLNNIYFTTNNF